MKIISRIMNVVLRSIVLGWYAYTVFLSNISIAGELTVKLEKTITVKGIEFILIPAGEFVMAIVTMPSGWDTFLTESTERRGIFSAQRNCSCPFFEKK